MRDVWRMIGDVSLIEDVPGECHKDHDRNLNII